MNLDDTMIARLLGTYGAPPTPNNVAAAKSFFASNPDIAERRAMGLRGSGIDDNSDVFGPMLEKFMSRTDLPPRNAKETYSAPEQESNPVIAQGTAAKPSGSPSRQGNYGPATDKTTKQDKDYGPGTGGTTSSSWLDDALTALLGLTSVRGAAAIAGRGGNGAAPNAPNGGPPATVQPPEATFVGRMGEAAANDPRAAGYLKGPQPAFENPYNRNQLAAPGKTAQPYRGQTQLEDNISDLSRVPTNEPPTTKVEGDPALTEEARRRQLQAEIDAENAQAARLQEQIAEQARRRSETSKLLKEGGRARFGRK